MATRGHETRLPIPEQGIHPEIHPENLGFGGLTDSQNMIFRDSRFQSREGLALLTGDQVYPYNLLSDEASNPTADWDDAFDGSPDYIAPPTEETTCEVTPWTVGDSGYSAGVFGNTGINVELTGVYATSAWWSESTWTLPSGLNYDSRLYLEDGVQITGGRLYSLVIWSKIVDKLGNTQPFIYIEEYDANKVGLQYHTVPSASSPTLMHARYLTFQTHPETFYIRISFSMPWRVRGGPYSSTFDLYGMTLVAGQRPDYWSRGQVAAPTNENVMDGQCAHPEINSDLTSGWIISGSGSMAIVPASQINGSMNGESIGRSFHGNNLLYFMGVSTIDSIETNYLRCSADPGTTYTVEVYGWSENAENSDSRIYVRYYDSGGSLIGGNYGSWEEELQTDGCYRNWKVFTTIALTAYISLQFGSGGTAYVPEYWIGAIKVYEGDAGAGPPDDWSPPVIEKTGPHISDEGIRGFYQYDYLAGAARSENVIVLGTNNGWWQYNIGTGEWDDITSSADPLNGGDNQVIFRAYDYNQKTYLLGCNGASPQSEKICKYDGTATYEVIEDAPKAKCLAVAGTRLIAGNCVWDDVYYPTAVIYSKTILDGHFDTWGAGDIIRLADTAGEIVAMEEMGNLMVAVYKTDSIYILAVQSGIYPFRPDLRATGISGPVSPAAVTALNNNSHAYLGRDAQVYLFDGSQPRALGPHIQTYLRKTLDLDQMAYAFLAWDKYHQELWVFYPAKGTYGSVRRALVIQMRNGFPAWPMRWRSPLNFTAGTAFVLESAVRMGDILDPMGDITSAMGELKTSQRIVLLGDDAGEIYYLNGSLDLQEAIECSMVSGVSDFGVHREVTIKEIEHYFQRTNESQPVTFRLVPIKSGEAPDMVLERQQKIFDISENQPYITEHRYTAPKFRYEYSIAANEKIDASGGDIAFAVRGRR